MVKFVAQGRAIPELQFGGAQREIIRGKRDFDLRQEAAGGAGPGLQDQIAIFPGYRLGKNSEARFQLGRTARKTGFQQ